LKKYKTINNLNELREHAIQTLHRLENKEIKVVEAGITAKLYENIISTVKTQLEYAKMLRKNPEINFMGKCTGSHLEVTEPKKISHDKKY